MAPIRAPPLALLLTLCCLLLPASSLAAASGSHDLLMLDRFHRWMSEQGRSYPTTAEKLHRFEVYRRNVEYIDATNRNGTLGYELGENEFTDLTHEEFRARYTGGFRLDEALGSNNIDGPIITTLAGDVNEGSRAENAVLQANIPSQIDWRQMGVVTSVKNQGTCGSCWAFSSAAAVEALHTMRGGQLVDLSAQQLLDCDTTSLGCTGGYPHKTFGWIANNGGITTWNAYPYVGTKQQCRVGYALAASISGGMMVQPANSEVSLQARVAQQPVVVAIDSKDYNLQHYRSGIYRGPCGTSLDHAVLAIGYGIDTNSGDQYWIIKNSWGTNWGYQGIGFLRRGADGPRGLCGIAMYGAFPY